MEYILVTGGLGYIGSHCVVELLNMKQNIIVLDNLSNSNMSIYDKIKKITNMDFILYIFDLQNNVLLNNLFLKHKIISVIHFAGLKSVNESLSEPILYYDNNIISTINLLQTMKKHNCKNIIFSSSCTVYGQVGLEKLKTLEEQLGVSKQNGLGVQVGPKKLKILEGQLGVLNQNGLEAQTKSPPVDENTIVDPTNILTPYGKTKYMIEQILQDVYKSDNDWNIIILRYFNPVSCHPSGILGEECNGKPNNLYPYILQVVNGKYDELSIFGNDYDTPDGTCVRDFIHVVDLATGHVKSLDKLNEKCGLKIYNLGTGKGTSVLEIVNTFEQINEIKIKYKFCEKRKGDIDMIYANCDKAMNELNWKPVKTLKDICRDGYNYIVTNK